MDTPGMLERTARWVDGVEEPAMRGLLNLNALNLNDRGAEELAPGVALVEAFSNVVAFDTDDGLVVFDVSHALADQLTNGYNGYINMRQFRLPEPVFPSDFVYPGITYRSTAELEVGGRTFQLRHARGETDDHTWAWVPDRRAVCVGDLFIWQFPNAGNPQKVQRFAWDWAVALREMAALQPELLLPAHGPAIGGTERVVRVLTDTAAALESLHDQTIALMNTGARLDDVIHQVRLPDHLANLPYLRPTYDEPEFVVRNLWRLYGGWYDGNPAHLKPAPDIEVASELAALAGGADVLADRAEALAGDGDLRLACHLAEMAVMAEPESKHAHLVRAAVYHARRGAEQSFMASGIYRSAAMESQTRATDL